MLLVNNIREDRETVKKVSLKEIKTLVLFLVQIIAKDDLRKKTQRELTIYSLKEITSPKK
jgi:hypothetical protein